MSILRGIFGGSGQRRRDAEAVPVREVGHRVFVERPPDAVWAHLVTPPEGAELGADCVRVLALPRADAGSMPEFAAVWRRSNCRLWAGMSTLVALEDGTRIVTRAADGIASHDLVTTLEPLDQGCVVSQHLDGVSPGHPAAAFAIAWLERALLGLKADLEGGWRQTGGDAGADEQVERVERVERVEQAPRVEQVEQVDQVERDQRDQGDEAFERAEPFARAREPVAGFGPMPGQPGVAPVSERASVEVAVPPERLWTLLTAPESEQLLKPTVERLVGIELADEPGVEHVLALHRRDDGRRAASVSRLVESSEPSRLVERDLTAPLESDVETTIAATAGGSVLTEALTAWLPSGPGRRSDGSEIAALVRARLEVVKHLAENGVEAQRDPRTGFLPPGQAPPPDPAVTELPELPELPGLPGLPGVPARPPVLSSVLLPPPHVVAPAAGYAFGHDWWGWSDSGIFFEAGDVESW